MVEISVIFQLQSYHNFIEFHFHYNQSPKMRFKYTNLEGIKKMVIEDKKEKCIYLGYGSFPNQ